MTVGVGSERLPHVAVIGAGVVGLSVAAYLAEAGCAVTVLERDSIACGSSGLSAGVYTEGTYADSLNIAMRTYAVSQLRAMRDVHGLRLHEIGMLRLAREQSVLDEYRSGLIPQRAAGIMDTEVLDRDQLTEIVPAMSSEELVGGLWSPRDGYLDGHELAMIYASRARSAGSRLMLQTTLLGASQSASAGHRLRTTQGEIVADFVVNAAGAWADRVGDILGSPVEIIAQRHQICVVNTREPFGFTLPEVMDNVPGTGEEGLWFRQEQPDQFLAGLHSNDVVSGADKEDPESFERGIDEDYVERLIELLLKRLPRFDMSLHSGWSGLYPLTPDGAFIIGPSTECPTVIQAAGSGGVGVNTSPVFGRLVTDWILTGAPSIPGTDVLAPAAKAGRATAEVD